MLRDPVCGMQLEERDAIGESEIRWEGSVARSLTDRKK